MNPVLSQLINGWNGKRVAFITEKEISEEYRDPTFDLVARIKLQRMNHAGHILRAGEEFLSRRILLADVDRNKWEGGLLQGSGMEIGLGTGKVLDPVFLVLDETAQKVTEWCPSLTCAQSLRW